MINIDVFSTYRDTDQYLLERNLTPCTYFLRDLLLITGNYDPGSLMTLGRGEGNGMPGKVTDDPNESILWCYNSNFILLYSPILYIDMTVRNAVDPKWFFLSGPEFSDYFRPWFGSGSCFKSCTNFFKYF